MNETRGAFPAVRRILSMSTEEKESTSIARLRKLAALAAALAKNETAQDLWAAHHAAEFGPMPGTMLYADFGHQWLEGLVVKGERTGKGWDLNGPFQVLTEDGVLRTVDGWMTIDLFVQAGAVEDEDLRPNVP